MIYAGIGSREAPSTVLDRAFIIGQHMARHGHLLRSGKANGCDTAFESGCDSVRGNKQIFIPWDRFNRARISQGYIEVNKNLWRDLTQLVKAHHPNYRNLTTHARLLMMRNCHQILGYDLQSPSDLVLFYAPRMSRVNNVVIDCTGGTGFAVRLAYKFNIPCLPLEEYVI